MKLNKVFICKNCKKELGFEEYPEFPNCGGINE